MNIAMAKVNSDLKKERDGATFDPDDITAMLYGREGMHVRRLAHKRVSEDPELKVAERFVTMPRDDVYDEAVRIFTVIQKRLKQYGYSDPWDKMTGAQNFFNEAAYIDTVSPFGLHHTMFMPTILSQGTDTQIAEYMTRAKTLEIIGTYAQTEMGHGTFLRGLETTATFDRERQHFVIHSPTVTSIKYWPGGLGKSSNYAVVMAQLVINGKKHGMHSFMCQLRDLNTHEPLKGVELGDINKKYGYDLMDNGYLKFTDHRIPRTSMLMKYAQVAEDGTYTRQAIPQISYLSMTLIRMMIVTGSADDTAMAATIATRYSAVRRQTANSKGIEPQILDYQTQQMKVLPAISSAYALFFTGIELKKIYEEILGAVQEGDSTRLPEIHSLTSGLKAYSAERATDNIEVCRRACGGHGYSHASGLPKLYMKSVPGNTYEGENTVMYLQCARSLVKFLTMAQSGQSLPAKFQFLSGSAEIPLHLKTVKQFDCALLCQIVQQNCLSMLLNAAQKLQALSEAQGMESAWNNTSVQLVEVGKAFAFHLTSAFFAEVMIKWDWNHRVKLVMKQVCEFYIINGILEYTGTYLQTGVLSPQQIGVLSQRRVDLLTELRPNAVALVDGFDYPDRMLNSCLGRYDGQVYDALFDYAKSSSLNKQEVHPSYHKYVKPMQDALKAKL